ncbi:1-deoxy-D-xylulose 5-phosphate reductoisomerase [Geosporobacter subterraneus DSM 17957]|uniref:1-deoxy-D-xylulose 5-phosphate reductoisomerase n=1 Tax=Geosporobacter subterraneus DSM 17957 TaxID=1121919 RepID=A0A1M6E1S5_9FIRM|nr:1-deoxy-D-xylulose-5-phosphate reductoisomerase [Geosporobacter subterraneus]SHI79218.1 1-deoxy-D-xylulose 5-phosphate reductoisomerase [Geosporobacter subterraneus DSM 17957]
MKKISILGSTGSIGRQTLDVVRSNRKDFSIIGLSGNHNIDLLEIQIREFKPEAAAVMDVEKALELSRRLGKFPTEILSGMEGLISIATMEDAELVVTSVVGMVGLLPTIEAIRSKKNIALANKETLVTAGELVMKEACNNQVKIIPVDSEHSAIFQCLKGYNLKEVDRIILTASGGPFRGFNKKQLESVSLEDALRHPKWNMGKKISIDSATLMNKGLEVIEAKWLFDLRMDQIEVIVHPQSIIHSMVEFVDSSILAQLGCPDMRVPIQFALTYPDRTENQLQRLDFSVLKELTFEKPDMESFPCLKLAIEAMHQGGSYPTVLNAANEVLVEQFLQRKIGFMDIPSQIAIALESNPFTKVKDIGEIIAIDQWTRDFVNNRLS